MRPRIKQMITRKLLILRKKERKKERRKERKKERKKEMLTLLYFLL